VELEYISIQAKGRSTLDDGEVHLVAWADSLKDDNAMLVHFRHLDAPVCPPQHTAYLRKVDHHNSRPQNYQVIETSTGTSSDEFSDLYSRVVEALSSSSSGWSTGWVRGGD